MDDIITIETQGPIQKPDDCLGNDYHRCYH
jgi:hypothetical protein